MRRYLVLLYVALQVIPCLLVPSYVENMSLQNFAGRNIPVTIALCLAPFVWLFEVGSLAMILGVAKGFFLKARGGGRRIGSLLFVSSMVLAVAAYFFVLCASWYLFSATQTFLGVAEARTFAFASDFTNLTRLMSASEVMHLGLAAFVSAVSALVVFLAAPSIERWSDLRGPLGHLRLQGLPVLLFLGIAFFGYSKEGRTTFWPVVINQTLPQYTLFIRPILSGAPTLLTRNELQINKAKSLDTYLGEIQAFPRKNVVLFIVEALRADVVEQEVHGVSVMPFLRKLAQEEISFPRAFAQAPETDYSQVTIYSGQYPLRSSVRDLHSDNSYPHVLIYELLSRLGYRTALITNEWRFTKRVTKSPGLDLYLDLEFPIPPELQSLVPNSSVLGVSPQKIHPAHLDQLKLSILEHWLDMPEHGNRPFFACIFLYSTHFPYNLPPEMDISSFGDVDLQNDANFFGYPKQLAVVLKNRYLATARFADSLLEQASSSLHRRNLLENTIFIVTGDHGELFHEYGEVTHGGRLRPEALQVPLVFGGLDKKLVVAPREAVVGHVDISPTILAALGLPPLDLHQGEALVGDDLEYAQSLGQRNLFLTSQGFIHEDGVIRWPWLFTKNLRSSATTLLNLAGRGEAISEAEEAKTREVLEGELDRFRAQQLSFYALPPSVRAEYSPPKLTAIGKVLKGHEK